MEKTSPFSRIMPVCSAVRLNEAGYVSPSRSFAAVLRDIFTMVTKCSCPGSDALRALPTSWWPALYNRLYVRANICLRDPHLCIHKHTYVFPQRLDNTKLGKPPHAHSLWRKESGGARRALPTVSAPSIRRRHAFASDPFHEICSRDVGFLFIFFFSLFLWKALYPEGMDLQACFDPSFMILLFVLATSPL